MVNDLGWHGSPPPFRRRVLIAAPHPDDEVLGCAGIMAWLVDHGFELEILAVTDGGASHARSHLITPAVLVERRVAERACALRVLGLDAVAIHRFGFADSDVASSETSLTEALRRRLDPATTLIVPWRHDGHPDHEAVAARSGIAAAHASGADLLEAPIWARVRGRQCTPSHVLHLGARRHEKLLATQAFSSQIIAIGPGPHDGPVVHPDEIDALTSPTEWGRPMSDRADTGSDGGTSASYFDTMWATGTDPWDHGGRFYEHRKYALTAAMVHAPVLRSVFEPGCATGLLTRLIAPRAERYLATDRHDRAVDVTRDRVADLPHVRVEQGQIPDDWPAGLFDTVILSEVLYYLEPEAVLSTLDHAAETSGAGAELVAVHYREPVAEHALMGDDVHALIASHPAWNRTATHLEELFVLESFDRR